MGVGKGRVGPGGWQSRAEDFVVKPSEREQTLRQSKPRLCAASSTHQEGGGMLRCAWEGRRHGHGHCALCSEEEVSSSTFCNRKV